MSAQSLNFDFKVYTHKGMSTIVVTPPAAAARVAVQYPSQVERPGSLT